MPRFYVPGMTNAEQRAKTTNQPIGIKRPVNITMAILIIIIFNYMRK